MRALTGTDRIELYTEPYAALFDTMPQAQLNLLLQPPGLHVMQALE
jgi:pyridoxine 5'-phosphate synthase PdxJ